MYINVHLKTKCIYIHWAYHLCFRFWYSISFGIRTWCIGTLTSSFLIRLPINITGIFFLDCLCVCVCVTVRQSVECVQIMRCCSSNLGQWPLRNLGYVSYCYVIFLSRPDPHSRCLMSFRGGHPPPSPTLPPSTSVASLHRIFLPPVCHLSPSQHTHVPWLAPTLWYPCSPPSDPPSLPPRLPDSCRCRTLAAA